MALHIGSRLKSLRERRGLNAPELERLIGERPGAVRAFESATRNIGAEQLFRLGRALEVDVVYFFEGLEGTVLKSGESADGAATIGELEEFLKIFSNMPRDESRKRIYSIVKLIGLSNEPIEKAAQAATMGSINRELARIGMPAGGAFHPRPADRVPGDPGTVILIGNSGPGMWKKFTKRRKKRKIESDPLDSWSRREISRIARRFGAEAMFPFDGPPYLPFQKWAMRAGPVHPSPLGVLIHPRFGLWHAYRGAIALPAKLKLAKPRRAKNPCLDCKDMECLTSCPAGAVAKGGFNVKKCASHISSPGAPGRPDGGCLEDGCASRLACPVGREYTYASDQHRFHMRGFLEMHGPG